MKLSSRVQKLIILSLTLLAFLLRAYRLDFQSYWIDEAWTVYFANLPISELWYNLKTHEFTPPFYFPSILYWAKLVGNSEFALRFYSTLFGVMVVPITYRLGKDLGGNRLGLLAALLITLAPYQIWHSQDARMYTILTASSAISMWSFVNLLKRGGWRWWLLYLIGTEWMILNHYHGLVIIGIQGLFLMIHWRRYWRRYLAWGGTLLLIVLLFTPWLIFGSVFTRSFRSWWIEQPMLWEALIRSLKAYSLGELVPHSQAIPVVSIFFILYVIGLIATVRRRWGSWNGSEITSLLVLYTIIPILVAWVYGEFLATVYFERYLIFVQVGYLITVAAGLLAIADGLRNRIAWGAPVLAGILALLLVGINGWVLGHHYFDPTYAKPNWRAVARTIEDFGLPGDAVVVTGDGGEKAFEFYYKGELPAYFDFNTPVPTEDQARQIIADIAANHHRIWYTPYGVAIDATLESWLAVNRYPAWQSWIGRKRLVLYGDSTTTNQLENVNISFSGPQGQALIVDSVALPDEVVAAGDVLPLTLIWLTTTELEQDYQLSLRLSNGFGDILAQSDWPTLAFSGPTSSWQPNQPITDHRGLWLPPDTSPGNYMLQLVVYELASGKPLGQPATISDIEIGPAETVVPIEALSVPNPIQQPVGNLTLIGYNLPGSIRPGEEIWLWLYWQAPLTNQLPSPESTLRLSLTSEEISVSNDFPLIDSVGQLESWRPGQIRRAIYHLPSPSRLSGDHAEINVALVSTEGQIEAEATLTQIELEQRSRQFKAPAMAHETDYSLGNPTLIKLIGYELPSAGLEAGDVLPATLYWQAKGEIETNYTVFLQLLNSDWQVVSQEDLQPQAGAAPTSTWLPGEILTDSYMLSLSSDLPPGQYRLITGMYNPVTGERLPIMTATDAPSGGDFVDLGMVTIQ